MAVFTSIEKSNEESLPRDATPEEIQDLVHEPAAIPATTWLLAFTGAASQFARFGVTVTWQNYLQNQRGNTELPGALGLGQATATTIQNAYLFFQYVTPLLFAMLSDAWLGRYRTMLISLTLLTCGYIVAFATALPIALDRGAGLGGFITTMILIGLGHGGLSAVMYPFIGDQIPESAPKLERNKKGDLVIADRQLAIQYVFNGYYWMANIAALSLVPTTLLEKHVGFWAAYLLPMVVLIVAIIPVLVLNKRLVKRRSEENPIPQMFRLIVIACQSGFSVSAAEAEHQKLHHNRSVPWGSSFVNEMRRGLKACRIIICFVVFWVCYNQSTNNIISQAGQMEQYGVSNDTIQALNPIACIIMGPLIQNLIFPLLRRYRVPLGPILRITVAFFFISAGLSYAAGLQGLIYSRGPCYKYPLECPAASEGRPGTSRANEVNMWLQTPLHFILAVGEVLSMVALNEFLYTEAPTSAKALIQALQQLSAAAGGALGMALGPVSKNPHLVVLFASLAGVMCVSAVLFWVFFRGSDASYESQRSGATDDIQEREDGESLDKKGSGNNSESQIEKV